MAEKLTPQEERLLRNRVSLASEQGWGLSCGLLAGLGLFVATAVLLIRGGPNVGAHLGLIGVYFPGYTVSWLGAFIGFVYAFVVGYVVGRIVATLYNRLSPS